MRRCSKHGHDRLPDFSCPVCALEERNRLRSENQALREALEELADLMQGVIDGDYKPDSFTLQVANAALAMRECEDLETLNSLATPEAMNGFSEETTNSLRELYKQRRAELSEST